MSQDMLAREVLGKYREEESDLHARIAALEEELGSLHSRLQEVRLIRAALEGASPAAIAAAVTVPSRSPIAAPAPTPRVVPAPAPAPVAIAEPEEDFGSDAGPRRKGRRPVAGASRIHDLGIVDAAIELARQRGVREADAGEILEWFKEAGYKGRHGLPTRNSIYVSLNREFQEADSGRPRVSRPSRGRFVFHFDNE